jgi:hypothetical protein
MNESLKIRNVPRFRRWRTHLLLSSANLVSAREPFSRKSARFRALISRLEIWREKARLELSDALLWKRRVTQSQVMRLETPFTEKASSLKQF